MKGAGGMRRETAIDILEALLDGVDPVTGEVLPEGHVCLEATVMRALHVAVVALQTPEEAEAALPSYPLTKSGKLNAGRPWTEEDNQRLIQLYLDGRSIENICQLLQRRKPGVNNQLQYLGLDAQVSQQSAEELLQMPKRADQFGKPWKRDDHKWMIAAWEAGIPISEMAEHLGRSEYAVRIQLEKAGRFAGGMTAEDEPPRWTDADNKTLFRMVDEGCSVEKMAEHFGRTPKAIQARLFYMGLSKDAPKLF